MSEKGSDLSTASVLAGLAAVLAGLSTAAAAPAVRPPPPAPPAFFSVAPRCISNMAGDAFDFQREDRKVLHIRLFDADSHSIGEAARDRATAVAQMVLEAEPFWVFPCGQAKGAAGDEVWARVWTAKGWLSEALINANYAKRRAGPEGVTLGPFDPTGTTTDGPPPAAPAFYSPSCTAGEPGLFEVEQAGKTLRVRLFDCTFEGVDAAQQEAAKAAAARLVGQGPVWVFPSLHRKAAPGENPPVRIWTRAGWVAEALIKDGLAKRPGDPAKGPAAPAESADTAKAKTPKPTPTTEPASKWRETSVTDSTKSSIAAAWSSLETGMSSLTALSAETKAFPITSPVWRLSWNLKPVREGGTVTLSLYRVDEKWQVRTSSVHVASFTGTSGAQYIRSKPGDFWIRVTGATELQGLKVEVPASAPAAPPSGGATPAPKAAGPG